MYKYLVITYFQQANDDVVETVEHVNSLSKQHKEYANMILDNKKKTVIRCMIDQEVITTTYDNLVTYLTEIHPDLFD